MDSPNYICMSLQSQYLPGEWPNAQFSYAGDVCQVVSHTVVFDISAVSSTLQRRHLWLRLANAELIVDYHNNIVKAVSFC